MKGVFHPNADSGENPKYSLVPLADVARCLGILVAEGEERVACSGSSLLVAHARLHHLDQLATRHRVPIASDWAVTLLDLWRMLDVDLFAQLEGDFAIAVWDRTAHRLVLARDILGNRPLHFAEHQGGVAFASLPLDVARAIGIVEPDIDQLAAHLALLPETGERTFFKGVRRLLPAHYLIVDRFGTTKHSYWPPPIERTHLREGGIIKWLSAEFDRAVAGALEGPVIASQLSGGLDSSMLVSSASRQTGPAQTIVAITGAPFQPDPDEPAELYVNEAEVAAETAKLLGIEHRIVRAIPESPLTAIDRWLPTLQRPILNACNLAWLDATYAAAQETGSRTLLQGLMGNFTLSYDGLPRLPALVRRGKWATALREAVAYRRYSGARWTGVGALAFGWLIPTPLFRLLGRLRGIPIGRYARDRLLRPKHSAVCSALAQGRRAGFDTEFRVPPDDGPVSIVQALWSSDPGPANLSIAARYQIDLVDPTGARRVIEACLATPLSMFFQDGKPRSVARALLKGCVPSRVLDEKRRGHQGADWRHSVERDLAALIAEVDHAMGDDSLAALIDLDRLRQLLVHWPKGGWDNFGQIQTYRRDVIRAVGALRFVRWLRAEAVA